jgi:hypothetical protein
MTMPKAPKQLTDKEIAARRDTAIKHALNTSPKPMSAYIGKSERAQKTTKSRVRKSRQSTP